MQVIILRDTWASGTALKASADPVALSEMDAVQLIRCGKAKPYVAEESPPDPAAEPEPVAEEKPKPKRRGRPKRDEPKG